MEDATLDFVACTIKNVPSELAVEAAERAIDFNPANRPSPGKLIQTINITFNIRGIAALADAEPEPEAAPSPPPTPEQLAVMTSKYWGAGGVRLTVGFPFDSTPADLQARILQHMNAWGAYCNVRFSLTSTDPQVRIARNDDGYWSYLGTDILSIPRGQPTMNLQGFTMNTPEREFRRVVRHETGHTLGFPHEHMRKELVARLDREKTIAYFRATQGWSPQVTTQQVLTPLNEASIRGTPNADQDSIMCYQLPAHITVDGQPIRGGVDIDVSDQGYAGKLYPLPVPPPPPPPPPTTVAVPDVLGQTWISAKQELSVAGLLISPAAVPNQAATVATQSPSAGTAVNAGSTVSVTLTPTPAPPAGSYEIVKTVRIKGQGTPPTVTVE